MELLIGNNSIVILFWLLLTYIISEKKEPYICVLISYVIIYIANLYEVVETIPSLICLLLTLFIYFEFLIDKTKRTILIKVKYMILDFIYLLCFQYGFLCYVLSIVFSTQFIHSIIPYKNFNVFWSFVFLFYSLMIISKQHYVVATFTEIKAKIDKICTFRQFKEKKIDYNIFYPLLYVEDKTYLERDNKYSIINNHFINKRNILRYLKKGILYLKQRGFKNTMYKFLRGYSTIEMQLIRTLGIKEGYDKVIYRKIYEIIYVRIFLDSLKQYYTKCGLDVIDFRCFLLYIYLNVAPPMGINKSIIESSFGKSFKNLETFSKEEVFILGLSFSGKLWWSNVFEIYRICIEEYDLNYTVLNKLKNKLKSKNQ